MKRDVYKAILLKRGFVFEKTQMGFPGRGEQDVFTHPSHKYKFYISHIYKDDESVYGFVTGKINGKYLDNIYASNAEDTFQKNRGLFVWVGDAFVDLMERQTA